MTTDPQTIYQVDAFTDRPYAGNPAAVCILPGPADEAWMRNVAAEMNLSETAFLYPEPTSTSTEDNTENQNVAPGYRLRWFTPTVEVDLCGHATLASAHTLWHQGIVPAEQTLHFFTRSGLLTAQQHGDWIELNFPALITEQTEPPQDLLFALGLGAIQVRWIGRSRFDLLVEVDTEKSVRSLSPDFGRLAGINARGVIVTAPAQAEGYDFLSRFFGPAAGVDEDPVTGSAHCCLAPFWGRKLGKEEMTAFQASARGGEVRVRLDGDRVRLMGKAVTVLAGTLLA